MCAKCNYYPGDLARECDFDGRLCRRIHKRFDYDDSDRIYEKKKESRAIEDAKNGVFYIMKEGIKQ
jgi:hypothetical protein